MSLFMMSYLFFCTVLWSTLVVLNHLTNKVGLDWIGKAKYKSKITLGTKIRNVIGRHKETLEGEQRLYTDTLMRG